MIRLHHLQYSRSTRIIWLLEELGEPYDMVTYERDPVTRRAPPSLKNIHPLGRAPVIEDGGQVMAESGAIIEYLVATYGKGRLGPRAGDPDWPRYIEWLHFGEGSAMAALMLALIGGGKLSPASQAYADESIAGILSYLEQALQGREYLVGDGLTGADIQMSYAVSFAGRFRLLGVHPALRAYDERLIERPAYQRAIAKGGPVMLPRR